MLVQLCLDKNTFPPSRFCDMWHHPIYLDFLTCYPVLTKLIPLYLIFGKFNASSPILAKLVSPYVIPNIPLNFLLASLIWRVCLTSLKILIFCIMLVYNLLFKNAFFMSPSIGFEIGCGQLKLKLQTSIKIIFLTSILI